jgi:hypothetical protein
MAKTKPVSIRSLGLRKYLNDTAFVHNNQGYDDFVFYIKYRIPKSAIGRMFNVNNVATIKKWAAIYEEESK